MKVFYNGSLEIFIKKGFTSNTGEEVEYNEAYFVSQDEDDVLKINTKQDLSKLKGQTGIVEIEQQKDGKMKLISFKTPQSRKSSED